MYLVQRGGRVYLLLLQRAWKYVRNQEFNSSKQFLTLRHYQEEFVSQRRHG
jgi:hypothetical protein